METKALREKLRDFEHVIETMHCGLVAEGLEGNIQFVNQRFLDWLGYEREELLGKHIAVLVPKELHQFMEDDVHAAAPTDRALKPAFIARVVARNTKFALACRHFL